MNTLTLAGGGVFGGFIVGSGGLTVASGSETLTGDNSFTGVTTVLSGGALNLGDGGFTGIVSGPIVLTGGVLTINRANAVVLGGSISGSGSLVQTGGGVTTLTGVSTFTGPTLVSAGTLSLSGSGTLAPTSVVTVASGGLFSLLNATGGRTIGSLSGAGSVGFGDGDLTLSAGAGVFSRTDRGSGRPDDLRWNPDAGRRKRLHRGDDAFGRVFDAGLRRLVDFEPG